MSGAANRTQLLHEDNIRFDKSGLAATVVIGFAMLIIALAIAVASHLHLAIAPHLAGVLGVGVFSLLLATHLLASRFHRRPAPVASREQNMAVPAIQKQATGEQNSAARDIPAASPIPQASSFGTRQSPQDLERKIAAAIEPMATPSAVPPASPVQPAPASREKPVPQVPQVQPAAASSRAVPKRSAEPENHDLATLRAPRLVAGKPENSLHPPRSLAVPEGSRSEMQVRREPQLPPMPAASPPAATTDAPQASPEPASPGPASKGDEPMLHPPVQNIEGILKRMAAQIQAGRSLAAGERKNSDSQAIPGPDSTKPVAQPTANGDDQKMSDPPRKAINIAVDALRAAADEMRNQIRESGEPKTPSIHSRLAEVAEAVSRDQLDIYLNPIMGLSDGAPRHFELTVLARTSNGDIFDPEDFREMTLGSGLMPLLDTSRLRHSAAIAVRLTARISEAAVFSTLESETLDNRRFFSSIEQDQANGHLPTALLVLALRQSDVRTFVPAQYQSLRVLRDMGFRFALQDVTDLDMNFDDLAIIGFEFVKLDAEVYLDGLRIHQDQVPAADVCCHLENSGLTVIVGDIRDEQQRRDIAASGVQLGQGLLFGPPSSVRRANVGPGATAAA